MFSEDANQIGRNFHLASIHFSTSKSDVFMRLTILNNNEEIISIEGKGSVVLPAFLFMRTVTNIIPTQLTSLFLTKEIRDYYLPNKQAIICRLKKKIFEEKSIEMI